MSRHNEAKTLTLPVLFWNALICTANRILPSSKAREDIVLLFGRESYNAFSTLAASSETQGQLVGAGKSLAGENYAPS